MKLNIAFREINREFKFDFGEITRVGISGEFPVYDGEYDVLPDAIKDVILQTENKITLEDVRLRKIPYSETSNSANGKTITIG